MSALPASVTATAPGKLMLFGEHAVVYGAPCLVTSVGLYVSATVERIERPELRISTPALRARGEERALPIGDAGRALQPETAFVEAVAARALQIAGVPGGLRVSTDGPALSYGLGSSSAVTAAAAAALDALLGLALDRRGLFDLAYAAVLDAQGKGSGFDVAAAIYGGTLWFETGGAAIEPLALSELPFLIGYSGAKVSTRRFVDGVGRLRERNPALIGRLFDTIAAIVAEARPALERRDWGKLGDLMDINQGLLDSLGVSTPPLATLITAAREAGALGAKLSGAGGGDCMYALAPGRLVDPVIRAIQASGEWVNLPLGVGGVRVVGGG
jgi:mevalonate kinase